MRHYYIVLYEAPNGSVNVKYTHCTKRFIFHHFMGEGGIPYKLLAITRISKSQYEEFKSE